MQWAKIIIISLEDMICMFAGSVITTNLANSQTTPISFRNVVYRPSFWFVLVALVVLHIGLAFLEMKREERKANAIRQAMENMQIDLLNASSEVLRKNIQDGNLEDAEKVLKMLSAYKIGGRWK